MLPDLHSPIDIFLYAILNRVELFDIVDYSNGWVWDIAYVTVLFGTVFERVIAFSNNTY
jgi:hypothetical protein